MAIDKIGSKALTDCSVVAADIAPGTVTVTQLAGSIANAKLANSTVTINGTAVALGASASIDAIAWQSVVVSDGSTVTTMVAGRGYFINNTSAAGIVKLPAGGTAGDTIAIKDYAGNFATNKLTIQRNGHNIQGVANDGSIGTNRASLTLVYIDATKGWLYTNESNVADLQNKQYVAATGGTTLTVSDHKTHVFTGDSNFVVSNAGNSVGSNTIEYLVVAGGGGGAKAAGGGGGAGGFRTFISGAPNPLNAPAGITAAVQTYPITVGAAGAGGSNGCSSGDVTPGATSVFSTITSAGGGSGGPSGSGGNGGSGRGGGSPGGDPGGTGNTPPTSPPQGNNGGQGNPGSGQGGGGGSAGAVGVAGPSGGAGGIGSYIPDASIGPTAPSYGEPGPVGSTRYFAGGGGTGRYLSGTGGAGGVGGGGNGKASNGTGGTTGSNNTGGGGGGGYHPGSLNGAGTSGGKGIVILRYKFQN